VTRGLRFAGALFGALATAFATGCATRSAAGDMTRVPPNSLPMRGAHGPFSYIDMGGMFTILRVRSGDDASSWYEHPATTVSGPANPGQMSVDGVKASSGE